MTPTESELALGPRVLGSVLPDPRRPGSVRLIVDGRPLFTLAAEAVHAEALGPGSTIDEAGFARLSEAADHEAALRTALRLLGRRPLAARDLNRRLLQKGHPANAAARAIEKAVELGLVDDHRFVRHYVETRAARGRGPLRLERDLAAMGVDRTLVARTLAEVLEAPDADHPDVEALALKRLGQLRGLAPAVRRRRVVAYLARRGYAGDPVRVMVTRLLKSAT